MLTLMLDPSCWFVTPQNVEADAECEGTVSMECYVKRSVKCAVCLLRAAD